MGQASYLLQHPEHYDDVFWHSVPTPVFWPMIVLAIAAAMVASQSIISGCFSIIRQVRVAFNAGCTLRLDRSLISNAAVQAGQLTSAA